MTHGKSKFHRPGQASWPDSYSSLFFFFSSSPFFPFFRRKAENISVYGNARMFARRESETSGQ